MIVDKIIISDRYADTSSFCETSLMQTDNFQPVLSVKYVIKNN